MDDDEHRNLESLRRYARMIKAAVNIELFHSMELV